MSFTKTVPASVPSLFHSSNPWVPSSAPKDKVPPTSKISIAALLAPAAPGLMSFTRTVPALVPSLRHSSSPCAPSSAKKYKLSPTLAIGPMSESAVPGLMSFTVPAGRWRSAPLKIRITAPTAAVARTSATTAVTILRLRCLRSRRRSNRSKAPGGRSTVLDSRSRIPRNSLIQVLHGLLERRPALERQGSDGRGANAERARRLLCAEAQHLREHERGPLPR